VGVGREGRREGRGRGARGREGTEEGVNNDGGRLRRIRSVVKDGREEMGGKSEEKDRKAGGMGSGDMAWCGTVPTRRRRRRRTMIEKGEGE
jgi:hypothetical protein